VIDIEGLASASVHQHLDHLGLGCYQGLVLVAIGLSTMAETIEMGAVSPINAGLVTELGLSDGVRDMLPGTCFAGAALGLMLAGPLSGIVGRKGVLVLSLIAVTTNMLMTSLLSTTTSVSLILLLRFTSGVAGALQIPAGHALAVESCDGATRGRLLFGIVFFSSFGYLVEAMGMKAYMPKFGDGQSDDWRGFCCFISSFSALALPLVMFLVESPCFLAVRGDTTKCVTALNYIAALNGKPTIPIDNLHVPEPFMKPTMLPQLSTCMPKALLAELGTHWRVLLLLSLVEGGKTFFISGTSYLLKDLFQLVKAGSMSPATLNIVVSFAPFVGLAIGERLLWLGVRSLIVICACAGAVSLSLVAQAEVRSDASLLVCLIFAIKVTWSPLNACISLMKLEAFATEVRVTAFAIISTSAKLLCIAAPTIVELLKADNTAKGWDSISLSMYIYCLAASIAMAGVLAVLIPGTCGDGKPLEDFVEKDFVKLLSGKGDDYGAAHDIWATSDNESQNSSQERSEEQR